MLAHIILLILKIIGTVIVMIVTSTILALPFVLAIIAFFHFTILKIIDPIEED